MWLLYDLIILLYEVAIRIAALFNPKARQWVDGRRMQSGQWALHRSGMNSQRPAQSHVSTSDLDESKQGRHQTGEQAVAWFHCASLGEFEQGRPVMEAFRKENPDWKILLTFFSPSGYEIRKDYEGADWVRYLPMDTPRKVAHFLNAVNPAMAVFVKYEFWFRYIDGLDKRGIPIYIISGIFRPGQHFFKWYGGWARKQLRKISHFFLQDQGSKDLLGGIGILNTTISGDTRFDRVASIGETAKAFPLVEAFSKENKVLIAGSTWPVDEELVLEVLKVSGKDVKLIIAPHEVHKQRIETLMKEVVSRQSLVVSQRTSVDQEKGNNSELIVLFSQLTAENAASARVIVVDGIGYLSSLYQYADVAYIGGGFGVGIHNILEAATFGKPVIFGPNYGKFKEAVDLVAARGAFSVSNARQFEEVLSDLFKHEQAYRSASTTCKEFVRKNCGATQIILQGLSSFELKEKH